MRAGGSVRVFMCLLGWLSLLAGCSLNLSTQLPTPAFGPDDPRTAEINLATSAAATLFAEKTLRAPTATPIPDTATPTITLATRTPTPLAPSTTRTTRPTFTLTATLAPTPTLAPTATLTPVPDTPTPESSPTLLPVETAGYYTCAVLMLTPGNNARFKPGAAFDATWTIQNTGQTTWNGEDIDSAYISGVKMHTTIDRLDTDLNVPPGKTVNITVPMAAPNAPGKYSETWSLANGTKAVCVFSLTIQVK